MKWLLCLALLTVASVANGQTITFSGFNGHGAGWATNLERLNGQWTSGTPKPLRLREFPAGQPQHPNETVVYVIPRQAGELLVSVQSRSPDRINPTTGFVQPTYAVLFIVGRTGPGTIMLNAYPGDPRRIDIQ